MSSSFYPKCLLIIFTGTLGLTGFAQKSDSAENGVFRHSIGLNTGGLLNQFLEGSSEDKYRTPYLITYSLELGKLAVRAGIGPEYTSETIIHDGFTDTEENIFLRMDGRIGAGIVVLDDHRWQVLAGLDAAAGYTRDRSIQDSGFDRITDQEEIESYGGGPFMQIAFHLSRRVSLSAESAVYWLHQRTTHTELFENFPDFNNIFRENSGSNLKVALPNSIFIRIHF